MVASKAEAIAMGVDKVQGSSFERGEDLGCFHTTVIFQKIYIIQSLKVPLTILALTFEKEMQTFWCSFQLVALTLSLSLSERGCSCHTSEGQRVQKGLLEIGNHYPTTSWPNKAYLVSNCP